MKCFWLSHGRASLTLSSLTQQPFLLLTFATFVSLPAHFQLWSRVAEPATHVSSRLSSQLCHHDLHLRHLDNDQSMLGSCLSREHKDETIQKASVRSPPDKTRLMQRTPANLTAPVETQTSLLRIAALISNASGLQLIPTRNWWTRWPPVTAPPRKTVTATNTVGMLGTLATSPPRMTSLATAPATLAVVTLTERVTMWSPTTATLAADTRADRVIVLTPTRLTRS